MGGFFKFYERILLKLFNDLVDDPIFQSLFSIHPVIPVKIFHHLFHLLSAIFGEDSCSNFFYPASLLRCNFQVNTNSLDMTTEARLMNHYLSMWINESAAFLATAKQDGSHGCCKSHTNRAHRAFHHSHGIIDYHTACNNSSRTINIKFDLFARL